MKAFAFEIFFVLQFASIQSWAMHHSVPIVLMSSTVCPKEETHFFALPTKPPLRPLLYGPVLIASYFQIPHLPLYNANKLLVKTQGLLMLNSPPSRGLSMNGYKQTPSSLTRMRQKT